MHHRADGVWLINHYDPPKSLAAATAAVRDRLGDEPWVGINPLGLDAVDAARLARSIAGVDGLWCDDAGIDPLAGIDQPFAAAVLDELGDWEGSYFGGVAFKYQSAVEPEFEAIAAATAAPRRRQRRGCRWCAHLARRPEGPQTSPSSSEWREERVRRRSQSHPGSPSTTSTYSSNTSTSPSSHRRCRSTTPTSTRPPSPNWRHASQRDGAHGEIAPTVWPRPRPAIAAAVTA